MTPFRVSIVLYAAWACVAAPTALAETALVAAIEAQPLGEALTEFASKTGLQVIFVSGLVRERQSTAVPPGLTQGDALSRLLEGTGLQYEFLNERTVRIHGVPTVSRGTPPKGASLPAQSVEKDIGNPATGLDEVVVSAMRREELASDVPISMFVWSQETMEASGIKGMTEIGVMTPGLGFDWRSNVGAGVYTALEMRGVTGRHGVSTGLFIDDTLLPAGYHDTYGRSFPATFDLERVEVVRGAQGMLLGQGTLGGAIRFIASQPSPTTFSGHASAEWATTAHGDMSYEAGVAAGGPLIDEVLGLRASGWYRSGGGFVDRIDPFTGAMVDRDANRAVSKSARIGLTWAPSDSVRITPTLNYESFSASDTEAFFVHLSDPDRGALRNSNLVAQPVSNSFYLASLKLTAGFHGMEFVAVTSLLDGEAFSLHDLTCGAGCEIPDDPDDPVVDAVIITVDGTQRVFSQEVRLASTNPDAQFTWLAGALYRTVDTRVEVGNATVIDEAHLEGYLQFSRNFGNVLTASAGWRVGRSSFDYFTVPRSDFLGAVDDSWVTPRFDLSYRTDEGSLLYLTAAKGYRSGGVAPGCAAWVYPADMVWDYEIGAKRDIFGGMARLEAGIFHMDWSNDQQNVVEMGCLFGFQRGKAVSNGFELSVQAQPTDRVSTGFSMSYTDAHYTQSVESDGVLIVRDGDAVQGARLPWIVTAYIGYEFPLTSGATVEVRAEDYFHGGDPGRFLEDNPSSPFFVPDNFTDPSTNLLNLHVNVRWASANLRLYVNNALDSQPTLNRTYSFGCCNVDGIDAAYTLTPRTIGVSATLRL
jgi:outer membrane receptor protein involved in Fe transport